MFFVTYEGSLRNLLALVLNDLEWCDAMRDIGDRFLCWRSQLNNYSDGDISGPECPHL